MSDGNETSLGLEKNPGARHERILLCIDLKPGTDRLLPQVIRYARALNAVVDIVHVAEPDPEMIGYIKADEPSEQETVDSERTAQAHRLRAEHRETQRVEAELRSRGVAVERALTMQGPALETILRQAERLNTSILMLGSHQHGPLYRLWYGDLAKEAVGRAPCALLVVPVELS